jgi:basic membrane lipoprotein Med (substrate-binding protein (PBP1-ABC) superfamily)
LVLSADSNRDNREQAQWILTSMLKRVNRPVLLLSRDFIRSGRVAERYQNFGLNFDAVGFAYNDSNRSLLSRDIIQRISDVRVMITNNQLNVPSSRIEVEEWLRTIR